VELAQLSGLPVSTTYRLAGELVDLGVLEPGDRGGYRIGLQLWETGSLAVRGLTLREVAVPYMQDLYEATHENVHLAVLDGEQVLYVEKITGRRSVPIKSKEARRLPLHATGVGKVLLAFAPDELFEKVVAGGLSRYTPHTIVVPAQLRRALAEIRRTGISYSREELTLGSVSVASPVLDPDGTVVAALSIVGRSSRVNLDRLGLAVRTAALGISREHQERGAAVRR
ncbi:MAG TPA: IclR family transcriptional regulator, partial [Mycobacteriales bacterium]|nr:IclR family transcriptional regulator [Mycobacteriales bacterium]